MTGPISKGTFNDIVSSNLDEIKRNFSIGLRKIGYTFDEDLFVDVGIRCVSTLNDKILTKSECVKYFWTAYQNANKNKYASSRIQIPLCGSSDNSNESIEYSCAQQDNKYDKNIDIICGIICKAIKEEFSDTEYNIWMDHFYNNKTYKELREIYGDLNFLWIFRKIKKYITQKLPRINPTYREYVENM